MVATSCLWPSQTRSGQPPGATSPNAVRPRTDCQPLLEASYVGQPAMVCLTDALAVETMPPTQHRSSLGGGSTELDVSARSLTRVVLPSQELQRGRACLTSATTEVLKGLKS